MSGDGRSAPETSAVHSGPVLVDSHCHLDMCAGMPQDIPAALARAADAGVERVVTVGIDLASSRRAVALAARHDAVWATVGLSPNDLAGHDLDSLEALDRLAGQRRVVAVGEIGLDYHWMKAPAAVQKQAFVGQLELADRHGLPVVIHSREAHADTLEVLRAWSGGRPLAERPRGVMHCFSGDLSQARAYNALGMLVSLAGNVTYRTADALRTVAAGVDADKLVLETDSPFLAPAPLRGQRNEPSAVRTVAELVADLRGSSLAEVARLTSANASRLFGWAPWPS